MSNAIVYSRGRHGIAAPPVTIEVHLINGIPGMSIVGLPETAVKESKDRVRSALINSNFEFPAQRVIVNLAPADLPKEGSRFDLPIAIGILVASEQLPKSNTHEYEFAGELALSGDLRPISGALPFAIHTQRANRRLIISLGNASEATLIENLEVLATAHLLDVCAHLTGTKLITPSKIQRIQKSTTQKSADLHDIYGQTHAKRALEIAASGNHSLLMVGPPGTGKTMLATRLTSILPDLSLDEALEVAAINSVSNQPFMDDSWRERPFRVPHHTASSVALVGGGSPPRPGEISLAHHGVLFLDELPEFNRRVLESLREPLESGSIVISRAAQQAEFPARFQLVAAMNPCPCGHYGNLLGRCRCTSEQIARYNARLSGPFLDRIDLHMTVAQMPQVALMQNQVKPESSEIVRARVTQARSQQLNRQGKLNALLSTKELEQHCALQPAAQTWLLNAIQQLGLSARAYHRVLRVARTISDLTGHEAIIENHLKEALAYRKREALQDAIAVNFSHQS